MSHRPTSPTFNRTLYEPKADATPFKSVQTARGARYRMHSNKAEKSIQAKLAQLEARDHTHPEAETVRLEKMLKKQDCKTVLAESRLAKKKLILAHKLFKR